MSLRLVPRPVGMGLVLALFASVLAVSSNAAASGDGVSITTLSNRADLISGDDALVQIGVPSGASASDLTVRVNGADVTQAFDKNSDGAGEGLIGDLHVGSNEVEATLPNGQGARLT